MNEGKQFEKDWQDSCPPHIYLMRVKDNPMWRQSRSVTASKNPCDFIQYRMPYVFLLEMKSTKGTSFSFSEKIIKQHQLDRLGKACTAPGVIAGLVFNFREIEGKRNNTTFFVHIRDFLRFKESCGKQSISIGDCKGIGISIESTRKKVYFRYEVERFVQDAVLSCLSKGYISNDQRNNIGA